MCLIFISVVIYFRNIFDDVIEYNVSNDIILFIVINEMSRLRNRKY